MIIFSAITPHPPIIIPGIGQRDDLQLVKNTIEAMEKLREGLEEAEPGTIVIISPHAPLDYSSFVINSDRYLQGDLANFGLDKKFIFENNLELAKEINAKCANSGIPANFHKSPLDHGALVPLYYLTKNIKPKLIHLAFSLLDLETHYKYGKIIGEACRKSKEKVAMVASGDLSHRLTPAAPAGYSPRGEEFDRNLIELLSGGDGRSILNMDEELVEEAGECGLRSFVILLGALGGKYNFHKLNYEGPFGVGYLTAELKQ